MTYPYAQFTDEATEAPGVRQLAQGPFAVRVDWGFQLRLPDCRGRVWPPPALLPLEKKQRCLQVSRATGSRPRTGAVTQQGSRQRKRVRQVQWEGRFPGPLCPGITTIPGRLQGCMPGSGHLLLCGPGRVPSLSELQLQHADISQPQAWRLHGGSFGKGCVN